MVDVIGIIPVSLFLTLNLLHTFYSNHIAHVEQVKVCWLILLNISITENFQYLGISKLIG